MTVYLYPHSVATAAVAPEFIKTIENTEAPIGSAIDFDAVVSGNPAPAIQWYETNIGGSNPIRKAP